MATLALSLLWHLLSIFGMRSGNIWTLFRASKSPFVLLTLDFVVAISALRISGSYLELDEEPESTGTNTAASLELCLPPYTFTSPTTDRDLPSLLHTQTSTHGWCRSVTEFQHVTAQRQGKVIVQSSTPQKYRLKGPQHVLPLQSLDLYWVKTHNTKLPNIFTPFNSVASCISKGI